MAISMAPVRRPGQAQMVVGRTPSSARDLSMTSCMRPASLRAMRPAHQGTRQRSGVHPVRLGARAGGEAGILGRTPCFIT
jgi:hypothetical protein